MGANLFGEDSSFGSFEFLYGNPLADPGNIFGTREGGFTPSGIIDPGGQLMYELTGSNFARSLADPAGILGPAGEEKGPGELEPLEFDDIGEGKESIDIEEQEAIALDEAAIEEKERRQRAARLGRKSTFKTSPFGLKSDAKVRGKTLFGS